VTAGCLGIVSAATTPRLARGGWLDTVRERLGGSVDGIDANGSNAAPARESVVAEGRFATYPGAEVVVSAELTGRLTGVFVAEGQKVRRGELLAEIASDELHASLAEAMSRLSELDADVRLRKWKFKRITQLAGTEAASAQELQEMQRDLETAQAQREFAAATMLRIRAQLEKARVLSPIEGTVVVRSSHAGQMVQPATPVVTVADLTRTRVEAEVNEFDGGRVRLGAAAVITAEGHGGEKWEAVVEEIPSVVVSRELRPQDPGRPSDTGVVMVKLKLLNPAPLKLGQRVEIRIDGTPAGTTLSSAADTR
jgi:RND family efflux transporter MFP subunit